MKKIKVISCTSNKYVGHTFECSESCVTVGNKVEIPNVTSKPFTVIKVSEDKVTLKNSHVTIVCSVE